MEKQNYCLWQECGWTCNDQKHGLFIFFGFIACPLLVIILFALKYSKIKTSL